MKSSLIKSGLQTCFKARKAAYLWGAMGVGKSQVVRQLADELFAEKYGNYIDEHGFLRDQKTKRFTNNRPYFWDIRMVLLDPTDLRGLPKVNGDNLAHWCPPDFLPKPDMEGIFFLDELSSAVPLVQASGYQLVLDRRVGEYQLPDGVQIVAAGNRETDKSVVHRMPMALANRFIHFDFEVDNDEWRKHAIVSQFHATVISFIHYRPSLLFAFDPKKNDKAFPTPRSWETVSELVKAEPNPEAEFSLFAGTVGEGAASEFQGFLKIERSLEDPDWVLQNPSKAKVDKDPAVLYAMCGALASRGSVKNAEPIMTYANRLPEEFSVLLVRDAVQYCPDIAKKQAKPYIDWVVKHKDVII